MTIKRFTPVDQWGQEMHKCMDIDENGSYVRASDYDALAARLAEYEQRLQASMLQRDDLMARLAEVEDQRSSLLATNYDLRKERDALQDRLSEYREGFRESMTDHAATLERLAEAERLLRSAVNPLVVWDGLADKIEAFLRPTDSAEGVLMVAPPQGPLTFQEPCDPDKWATTSTVAASQEDK